MAPALLQGAIGGSRRERARPGRPRVFPPELTIEIKALACERPATLGLPLSRLSVADIARHAQRSGLVASISDSTVWRCTRMRFDLGSTVAGSSRATLHFQAKAGRNLNLYERRWQGQALRHDEFVISTNEKTSIQARLNDFPCLEAVAERLANFERHFESIARPFEWKFTRTDLNAPIMRMRDRWVQSQPLKLARLKNTCVNFRNGLLSIDVNLCPVEQHRHHPTPALNARRLAAYVYVDISLAPACPQCGRDRELGAYPRMAGTAA